MGQGRSATLWSRRSKPSSSAGRHGFSALLGRSFAFHPAFHVGVGRTDQIGKGRIIENTSYSNLHVTHALATAFQQTRRISEIGAAEETHSHMRLEGIDVGECRVGNASGRMPIVHQLAHVTSALPDDLEPTARDLSQF